MDQPYFATLKGRVFTNLPIRFFVYILGLETYNGQ